MNEVDKNARIIWDYMLMHQNPKPMDAIFALGSNDLRVAERAAELYINGFGKYVICAGGNGKASDFPRPEAEMFSGVLLNKGVPAEKIILEKRSTNTGENILFTKTYLEEKGFDFKSFILVQKPYMERRTFAAFCKQWPGPEFIVTSPQISFDDYTTNKSDRDRFIHVMIGDLQRIKEYPAKGFQITQEIPHNVWSAYERLVGLGYIKYVMKTHE